MVQDRTSRRRRLFPAAAILAATALISYQVATWTWTPDGERWIAFEDPERFESKSGVLFLDRRIAPIVQKHYARLIGEWWAVFTDELGLVPETLPTSYFFYDRETFEEYAKPDDSVTRAFYRGRSHEVYTHGSFLGGQLADLDEEEIGRRGVMIPEEYITPSLISNAVAVALLAAATVCASLAPLLMERQRSTPLTLQTPIENET